MFRALKLSKNAFSGVKFPNQVVSVARFASVINPAAAQNDPDCPVTIDTAKKMPKNYKYYSNDIIITLSVLGDQDAREERLIRHIMVVDNIRSVRHCVCMTCIVFDFNFSAP